MAYLLLNISYWIIYIRWVGGVVVTKGTPIPQWYPGNPNSILDDSYDCLGTTGEYPAGPWVTTTPQHQLDVLRAKYNWSNVISFLFYPVVISFWSSYLLVQLVLAGWPQSWVLALWMLPRLQLPFQCYSQLLAQDSEREKSWNVWRYVEQCKKKYCKMPAMNTTSLRLVILNLTLIIIAAFAGS